jgi:hypothetical protein
MLDFHGTFRALLRRKSATWDRRLYFPSELRRAEDFFALKNPTGSAGFEPTNLGTKGQHATPRPPKLLKVGFIYDQSLNTFPCYEGIDKIIFVWEAAQFLLGYWNFADIFFSLEGSDNIYSASKVHVKLTILAQKLQILLPIVVKLDSSF